MRSVKSFIAAGAATLLSSAVFAADMAIAPPPYGPPVVEDFGGWYLRGDIGFSNQRVKTKEWHSYSSLLSLEQDDSFDTAGIFGVGVGYRFNNWFRTDVTGQYRGKANLHGTTDRLQQCWPAHSWCRYLYRQQIRMAGFGQRLCGSRYLVVRDAVHRRRRRLLTEHDLALCRYQYPGGRSCLCPVTDQSGILPGLCILVWLIGSLRTSRWKWGIAT